MVENLWSFFGIVNSDWLMTLQWATPCVTKRLLEVYNGDSERHELDISLLINFMNLLSGHYKRHIWWRALQEEVLFTWQLLSWLFSKQLLSDCEATGSSWHQLWETWLWYLLFDLFCEVSEVAAWFDALDEEHFWRSSLCILWVGSLCSAHRGLLLTWEAFGEQPNESSGCHIGWREVFFYVLTSKIPPLGSKLWFGADIKKNSPMELEVIWECDRNSSLAHYHWPIQIQKDPKDLDHETGVYIHFTDSAQRCFDFGHLFRPQPSTVQPPQIT